MAGGQILMIFKVLLQRQKGFIQTEELQYASHSTLKGQPTLSEGLQTNRDKQQGKQ